MTEQSLKDTFTHKIGDTFVLPNGEIGVFKEFEDSKYKGYIIRAWVIELSDGMFTAESEIIKQRN